MGYWDENSEHQGSPKSLPHKLVTSLNKLSMLGPKVKGDNSHLLVISEVSFQVRLLRSGVNLFEEFYWNKHKCQRSCTKEKLNF